MKPVLRDQPPLVLADDPFLASFVEIFQELSDGLQEHAASVPLLADPTVAPPPMVRYLASWVGAELSPDLDEAHQRRVAAGYGPLLSMVGTPTGTRDLLALLTEGTVTIEEHGGVFALGDAPAGDKRVTITLATVGRLDPDRLVRLIGRLLPADVHAVVHAPVLPGEDGPGTWEVRPGAPGRRLLANGTTP